MRTKCWNCRSNRYVETVSRENCPDCGIFCDYHGGGANDSYNSASRRQHEQEEVLRQIQFDLMFGD